MHAKPRCGCVKLTNESDTDEIDAGLVVTLVGCIPSRGAATIVKTAQTKLALTCVAAAMTEACTSLAASTSSTRQVIFHLLTGIAMLLLSVLVCVVGSSINGASCPVNGVH